MQYLKYIKTGIRIRTVLHGDGLRGVQKIYVGRTLAVVQINLIALMQKILLRCIMLKIDKEYASCRKCGDVGLVVKQWSNNAMWVYCEKCGWDGVIEINNGEECNG